MAYEMESELETEFEEELEDESEEEMEDEAVLEGEGWLGALGNIAGSLLSESEDEYEGEDEYEDEISPVRKVYADAMMEHLGELAAEAETEDEAAEHFLPLVGMAASKLLPVVAKAVAPMAKKALPKIASALTKATPKLTRGVGTVAKALHRNPQTRHLLRAVPGIARRTVGSIAHKVARGGHVTPRTAVQTLARQTRRVLGTPHHRAQALRRHHHLERRFHRHVGPGMGRAHAHYGPAAPGTHTRYGYGVRRVAPGAPRVTGQSVHAVHHAAGSAPAPAGTTTTHYGAATAGPGGCSCPKCVATYCRCCGQVIR
ncbi:hypothetical protein [Acidicapsa acidisoli]|uniref:hypothetical protein n=1 Tax=Acidicapsa acidisoli TaxID=1615681 RepID=UPI0021DF8A3A|nr:hypothetical protein [Acidicapsa acidisoli]